MLWPVSRAQNLLQAKKFLLRKTEVADRLLREPAKVQIRTMLHPEVLAGKELLHGLYSVGTPTIPALLNPNYARPAALHARLF
jgi:hypothetical protein